MMISSSNKRGPTNNFDSAYYNKTHHISFSECCKKYSENNNSSVTMVHRQQNDNITLVATDDEDESEQDEKNNSNNNEEQDDDRFFNFSFLYYLDEIYSRYSPAIVLENKGNTARDHLANERTYLAYFRTSLSLITLGIGVIQVYHVSTAHHKRLGRALGLIFVMASILFLYFGNVRYFHAQWALQHGNFPASRGIVTWASFCILFLFVGMFTVMLLETFTVK